MKVCVFGGKGTLGSAVISELIARDIDFWESPVRIENREMIKKLDKNAPPEQIWINCAGVLRNDQYGYAPHTVERMVAANAYGPHVLAETGRRVITISTDSVFAGNEGPGQVRTRHEIPRGMDLYAMTKRIGEQVENNSLVLRTSFMSPRSGILRMVLDAARDGRSDVKGYNRSYWSGSTVYEVARGIVDRLYSPDLTGIHHLSTMIPISKATAIAEIVRVFDLDIQVDYQNDQFVARGLLSDLPPLKPFAESLVEHKELILKDYGNL